MRLVMVKWLVTLLRFAIMLPKKTIAILGQVRLARKQARAAFALSKMLQCNVYPRSQPETHSQRRAMPETDSPLFIHQQQAEQPKPIKAKTRKSY